MKTRLKKILNRKGFTRCDLCGRVLIENYCTTNVCEECCKKGKCRMKYRCKAYPSVLEKMLKIGADEVIANPSKRVQLE